MKGAYFLVALYSVSILCSTILVGFCQSAQATPPEYRSFHRPQRIDYKPADDAILRIWTIYVGQGDAIWIEFPDRFKTEDGNAPQPVEVLVDGGPTGRQLLAFLRARDPQPSTIEHVILTHHDGDHVEGLTALLEDEHFGVGTIYHNGLASWRLGATGFPVNDWPPRSQAVQQKNREKGMALLESDGRTLKELSLMSSLNALGAAVQGDEFVGSYGDFANAIISKSAPQLVDEFKRTHRESVAISATAGNGCLDRPSSLRLEPIWPRVQPQRYGGWSYTINGNSIAFKLVYDNFSMLFTGDLNEDSERALLETLEAADDSNSLKSDVLKVPHHGSWHGEPAFFDAVDPVVSVASMGSRGFRPDWKHPSNDVISWLGGPHRVYHTYIHERAFRYTDLTNKQVRDSLIETRHVLIETDGCWFRVVEVENPTAIPDIKSTKRGNGTRWIRAKEQNSCCRTF